MTSNELLPLAPALTFWNAVGIAFTYVAIITVLVLVGLLKIPVVSEFAEPCVGLLLVWYITEKANNCGLLEAYNLNLDGSQWKSLLLKGFKYGFVLIFIQILVITAITLTIMHAGHQVPKEPAYAQLLHWKSSSEFTWKFVLIALVAPFNEELLARGLLFAGLRKRMGFAGACLTSSFLFGCAHVYPVHVIVAFVLGLMLCFLAERTKSLIPGFVCHVMLNAFVMFTLLALSFMHVSKTPTAKVKADSINAVQSASEGSPTPVSAAAEKAKNAATAKNSKK